MTRGRVVLALALVVSAWAAGRAMAGEAGGQAALAFGGFALALQVAAEAITASKPATGRMVFPPRWPYAILLRLCGVAVFGVTCALWPARFPAGPSAVGMLGVMVPLLFTERRG